MAKVKRRIGIMTGGGDCPGLNAVIRAIVKTAVTVYDMEVVGFEEGYKGLVDDKFISLTFDDVSNILTTGGTILGTSNRDNFFGVPRSSSQLVKKSRNRIGDAKKTFVKHKLECLICIGGDGTLTVAENLFQQGLPAIGVPKTIDNDVMHTDQTFGFDTAKTVATEALDRLHSTAASHKRIMLLEVMGRSAGWIALHTGIAGGGDIILIPEIPFELAEVSRAIEKRFRRGRPFSLVVVAEGAHEVGAQPVYMRKSHMLSGISMDLAEKIAARTGLECRATILGHLQRGGTPTPFDRLLATRYGHAVAHLAGRKEYGQMVALRNDEIATVPLKLIAGTPRRIPLDSPILQAAKDVGTSFGIPT